MTDREQWIYKILTPAQWVSFQEAGVFAGAPVDQRDGFIHLSARQQVAETARRHFADEPEIWLVAVDARRFGDALKWEISRGGDRFPHLYGELKMDDVVDHQLVSRQPGEARFEINF